MKVLVCGGRDFKDRDFVWHTLDHVCNPNGEQLPPNDILIIHGHCKTGVDRLADNWAIINWVPTQRCPADWERYGKSAGPIRNQRMLDCANPDIVVAFPGGRGTADMVGRAWKAGIRVVQANP